MEVSMSPGDVIELNIGGTHYTTTRATLTRYPGLLADLANRPLHNKFQQETRYFIDRNGKLFAHVLDFLRNGQLSLPSDFTEHSALLKEVEFYRISALQEELQRHRYGPPEPRELLEVYREASAGWFLHGRSARAVVESAGPEMSAHFSQEAMQSLSNGIRMFSIRLKAPQVAETNWKLRLFEELGRQGFRLDSSSTAQTACCTCKAHNVEYRYLFSRVKHF